MSNELKRLDFSPGIKADNINLNFDLVHEWLKRERLRVAGYGLVEGFNMTSSLHDFTITVGQGMLINESGEEIEVPENTFRVGPPDCIDISEEIVPDNEGVFKLKFAPYSPTKYGYIFYNPPADATYPAKKEFYVTDINSGSRVPVLSIIGQNIIVNAINWSGRKLKVDYKYSRNRVDSIMLHKDGSYLYQKGIMSTSPSHVDLGDYPDYRAIGLVYWQIGRTISIQFFDTYRSYRKVYVDKQNRLYLNGKLYKEAQEIYFVKPEIPQVNDLWYDHLTNLLMIWKEQDGDFGWVVVNDISTVPVREMKMWTLDTFPADAQTFMFDEDELNLHYIPNTNALEVVIDNAPLMNDQFSEIVTPSDKPYLSQGVGFKLKEPLDRATFVQVIVHHSVRNAPLRETFQRAAIFVSENFVPYNIFNTENIFTTETPFVIGEQQLEVFVEGKRLDRSTEYVEMLNDTAPASGGDRGEMSTTFKVLIPLASGETVTHKITRHVWSYDHLDQMVHDIEDKADGALANCAELKNEITALNNGVYDQFTAIGNQIAGLNSKVADLGNFIKKTDKLVMKNMPEELLAGSMAGAINEVKPTNGDILLADTKITDLILVHYISATMSRILMRDTEYTLEIAGNGVRISLHPDLVSSGANLYITGIKFGI
jgi:hypothetical protein